MKIIKYLFDNGKKIIKFKAKDSEIVEDPICLGNISKDFSAGNKKKAGLCGSVYYFNIDRNATAANDILDAHNYLIKSMSYKQCFDSLKMFSYSNDIF